MNTDIGKTMYYLLGDDKLLHICSDGMTACGLDAKTFSQVADNRLGKYEICSLCKPLDETLASKRKKATFETKAEIVEVEPVTGKII